jgi:hypothetical protein
MYSLALNVRVIDNDTKQMLDETEWPLVLEDNKWWRGSHDTNGTMFPTLTECVREHEQLKKELLEGSEPPNQNLAHLWSSILSTRGAVTHGAGNKTVTFELLLVNRTASVLERNILAI